VRKCEPVYTNCTACVALETRSRQRSAILRDLRAFRMVWKLHHAIAMGFKRALAYSHQALYSTTPMDSGKTHATIGATGTDFPKSDIPS
jgi:hypothetical protein